jgi:hypothetical protein
VALDFAGRLVLTLGKKLSGIGTDEYENFVRGTVEDVGVCALVLAVLAEDAVFFALPLLLLGSTGLAAGAFTWSVLHVRQYSGIEAGNARWALFTALAFLLVGAGYVSMWLTCPPFAVLYHVASDLVAYAMLRKGAEP